MVADSENARSECVALRLGFQREGLLRQHMMVKDRSRDTMIFSIVDREWPSVKTALVSWISDENFAADGNAKRCLEDIKLSLKS